MAEASELRHLCFTLGQTLAACGPDDLMGDEPSRQIRELHYALCSAALSAALLEGDRATYERAAALYREEVLKVLHHWQPTLALYELAGQPNWARLYRGLNLLGHGEHERWISTLNKLRPEEGIAARSHQLGAQEFVGALWDAAPELKAALLHSLVSTLRCRPDGPLKDLVGHPRLVNWTLAEQTELLRAATDDDGGKKIPTDRWRKSFMFDELRLGTEQDHRNDPAWKDLTADDQLLWIELWAQKGQP